MIEQGEDCVKKKYADRATWTRVLKRRDKLSYVENEKFSGYISVIYVEKVKKPLVKSLDGQKVCIVDDGYTWVIFMPDNLMYSLTMMLNEKNEIVQWYFDICKAYQISESGVPFFEDLYLDIVVLPSGNIMLLDEDELSHAFKIGAISENEYNEANKQADLLIEDIKSGTNALLEFSKEYYKNI
jgi:predicted RNA-binding protein associated with RNAse of E/G family